LKTIGFTLPCLTCGTRPTASLKQPAIRARTSCEMLRASSLAQVALQASPLLRAYRCNRPWSRGALVEPSTFALFFRCSRIKIDEAGDVVWQRARACVLATATASAVTRGPSRRDASAARRAPCLRTRSTSRTRLANGDQECAVANARLHRAHVNHLTAENR
jgi:hypothetical protein